MYTTVKTACWEATFTPEHGGQLVRLKYLPRDRDILHYPESDEAFFAQPERFGVPVLFPPNRISGGNFEFEGRSYSFPINDVARGNHIHGVVLHEPWEMVVDEPSADTDDLRVRLSFTHDDKRETFGGYPHRFRLIQHYLLREDCVEHEVVLENLDEADSPALPFGLGYHTAFRVPNPDGAQPRLFVTAADYRHEMVEALPSLRHLPWPEGSEYWREGGLPYVIEPSVSVHTPALTGQLDGQPFRGALLDFEQENLRVVYAVDEAFGQWFLWAPPDDLRALCIEPMTCMANAAKLPLPAEESGWLSLAAGQSWRTHTQISVESL
ncbi:MAG: aldose 1-epimerase [Puniceicoccales bacterium]